MAISEAQRQSYLETMGIQSYFPRFILPSAKESEECLWPEEIQEYAGTDQQIEKIEQIASQASPETIQSQVLAAHNDENRGTGVGSMAAGIKSLLEKNTELVSQNETPKTKVPNNLKPVKVSQTELKPSSEELRFQLAFVHVNDKVCVLNQMPYIGTTQLSNTHKALLLNILRAVKINIEAVQFDPMPFRWPIGDMAHIEKSEAAASATLNSYLEQKHSDAEFKQLLVMGEMSANFVDKTNTDWQVINTHSLDEMLAMPRIKRDVWLQLTEAFKVSVTG